MAIGRERVEQIIIKSAEHYRDGVMKGIKKNNPDLKNADFHADVRANTYKKGHKHGMKAMHNLISEQVELFIKTHFLAKEWAKELREIIKIE